MIKRLQNKIAESRLALPVTSVIAIVLWFVYGLVQQNLWLSSICFAVTTYLMVELNNSNSLIRIYSRMVSCSFMFMICSSVYLFSSLKGRIIEVCIALFYILFLKSFVQSILFTEIKKINPASVFENKFPQKIE